MVRDEDFLAAAAVATKALRTAERALVSAQSAESREIPEAVDLQSLLEGVVSAIQNLRLPPPVVTVEAASAPNVQVDAPNITVQAAAAPINNFSPSFVVDVPAQPAPVVNVEAPTVNIEPAVINVAAPSVRVDVPPDPPARPWRMVVVRNTRTQLIESADIYPTEVAA